MRIWHLIFAVGLAAIALKLAEIPAGRVALVVFVTGLVSVAFGSTGLLWLFQTFGAIGAAEGPRDRLRALGWSFLVLMVATAAMVGAFLVGAVLLRSFAL